MTADTDRLTPVTDEAIQRVRDYRDAARRVLRSDLTPEGRVIAVTRLFHRARREPLAQFAVDAVVGEVCWEIDRHDAQGFAGPDPLVARHRRLRGVGYSSCPECWSPLVTEADAFRWAQMRRVALEESEAREGAVR